MELPKNIVQIGNPDKRYKIFVEDYVISYIKQINRSLKGGQAGIALFGKKYAEEEIQYFFLYGAAEIRGLENKGVYLSESEKEQIEFKRTEFFEEQEFLAWCTLSGEMPEGFYLLDNGKGLLINGYATFFEKNDNMLSFMVIMENRDNDRREKKTEDESSRKYEWGRLAEGGNIDHRLLERNQKLSEARKNRESIYRGKITPRKVDKYERNGTWKTFLTGVAVMLCVIGVAVLSDEEKIKGIQTAARQILQNINEQKLPELQSGTEEETIWMSTERESLTESGIETDSEIQRETPPEPVPETLPLEQEENRVETEPEEVGEGLPDDVAEAESEVEVVPATTTYVVKKGDMLRTICREYYGSVERVKEICQLNGIADPDDIKVGQIILLPE